MYTVKRTGTTLVVQGSLSKESQREFYESRDWKVWRTVITPGTCYDCASMNGRILSKYDKRVFDIPVHDNCRCYIEVLMAIVAGTATHKGADGVDWYVVHNGRLPDYYISEEEATALGWKKWLGNLGEVLPGRVIGGKLYKNRDKRLPDADGRIWHEADFDYTSGYRNTCRLLYSNDGLVFVTYDHYMTFYEIGLENLK